jgi:hypothetical protein
MARAGWANGVSITTRGASLEGERGAVDVMLSRVAIHLLTPVPVRPAALHQAPATRHPPGAHERPNATAPLPPSAIADAAPLRLHGGRQRVKRTAPVADNSQAPPAFTCSTLTDQLQRRGEQLEGGIDALRPIE